MIELGTIGIRYSIFERCDMARTVFALLAVMILAAFSSASFAQQGSANQNAYSFLFVQTATSMSYKDGKLTLKKISPSMIFFTDRPERMAGHFPTTHFLKMWDEGKDNFKNDPPNANLSIIGEKGKSDVDVVVELSNPALSEKGDLTYDVRILDGDMPAEGGITSLFIDWWIAPDGAVCHYNWYTGYRTCRFPGPYYWGPYARPYWRY